MIAATLTSNTKKYLLKALLPFLAFGAMLAATPVMAVEGVIATVIAGHRPAHIAVNQITNKIYVTNVYDASVTVIDGATNSTSTVAVGTYPNGIAVNTVTNKIYVANNVSKDVTVIDGATNATTTVAVGELFNIAVNPATNKIYVPNYYSKSVTVIDGATNSTSKVPAGANPWAIAVNPVTNKIYVTNGDSNDVTVIDGATNNTSTVAIGATPYTIAVNSATNKIYVTSSNGVTVIDGATNNTSTVAIGTTPAGIAVNLATNKIYVPRYYCGCLTVIDGATNNTTTVAGVGTPYYTAGIAINPVTNRVYVVDTMGGAVEVIGELNIDTTPPSISANQSPLPNADGWNNTNVTVTFTATDDVSTPTCTVNSVTLTAEGTGQVVSTTCSDAAGNSASASRTVNIDKTPPTLVMPNLNGSYPVGSLTTLTFAATDTQSQVASISAALNGTPATNGGTVVLNQLGTNTFTLTANDKAGNTSTQSLAFTVGHSQSVCNNGIGNGSEGCVPGKAHLNNPFK